VINEGPVKRLLTWWFAQAEGAYKSMGFERNADTDNIIREKFESDWKMASLGRYDNWDDSSVQTNVAQKITLIGRMPRQSDFMRSSSSEIAPR
jgi:uncharacterized protein (DUF924 family)